MTASFYDELAPFYHLLYRDWEKAIGEQGAALGYLLQAHGARPGSQVLDAACGIGTQSLGLAAQGYQVSASDTSAGALARLRDEAARRKVQINAFVDDLRSLAQSETASLDAIVACDNSIPHLLSDDDLLAAFRSALRVLRPGGVAAYSVRDYARTPRKQLDIQPYGVCVDGQTRVLAVQVWEWHDDQYDLRLYLTRETADGACSTRVLVTRYYAVTVVRLMELMA